MNHAPRRTARGAGWKSWKKDTVALLAVVTVALTARSSFADHYYVPSGSMLPTIEVHDRIVVNKLSYGLRLPLTDVRLVSFASPSRGDVVVLESPETALVLLKRVVAVPGDRVRVVDGTLELNGVPIPIEHHGLGLFEDLDDAHHRVSLDDGGGPDFGPVTLPEDKYLVMGDNRGNSRDGRFFGFVEGESILGRAISVFVRDGQVTWIPL